MPILADVAPGTRLGDAGEMNVAPVAPGTRLGDAGQMNAGPGILRPLQRSRRVLFAIRSMRRGVGTYARDGSIFSSLCGIKQLSDSDSEVGMQRCPPVFTVFR